MVGLLYNIFVYNYNSGEKSLSFNRIKRLLSNDITDFENDKLNFKYLFQLLNLGIIDKVKKNRFSLSNSLIITNTKNSFIIGINLPGEVLKKNNHLIKKEYLGLTIFDGININILDYDIKQMVFILNKSIDLLQPVRLIIKNWEPVVYNELGQITKLEKYNSEKCKFENSADNVENNKLYKFYLYNGNYFKYLFLFNNKYYLIEPDEYEKVNTLKLINANKALFRYNKLSGEIKLKPYHTYPVYFYKIMLLNHIMTTGDIAINHHFKIELKQFLKITKILNLNYTLE